MPEIPYSELASVSVWLSANPGCEIDMMAVGMSAEVDMSMSLTNVLPLPDISTCSYLLLLTSRPPSCQFDDQIETNLHRSHCHSYPSNPI